jgi:hypothetical protein
VIDGDGTADVGGAADARRRSMTCDAGTAPAMTRALVLAQVVRPGRTTMLYLGYGLAAVLVASVGGGIAAGVTLIVASVTVVALTYRRMRRLARKFYPAGSVAFVQLADETLTVGNHLGEVPIPYSSLEPPLFLSGHLIFPVRHVRARVPVPPGLLTPDDVAWLRERISRAESQEPLGTPFHAATPQTPTPETPTPETPTPEAPAATATAADDVGGVVVITEQWALRASQELLRARLRSQTAVSLLVFAVGVWVMAGGLTGDRLTSAVVAGLVTALFVAGAAARSRHRSLRTSGIGRSLRSRFDETELHLESDGVARSIPYSAIQNCVIRRDVVLLTLVTGKRAALPRELVPDEALPLLGARAA